MVGVVLDVNCHSNKGNQVDNQTDTSANARDKEPIRLALTWAMLCLAVVLTVFSVTDISSGVQSTALWISAVGWPIVVLICGYLIRNFGK